MLIKNNNIGYSKEKNVLGAIVMVNLLDNKVTLLDENDGLHTVDMDDVLELREVGSIGNTFIYENDVVKVTETGKLYEIVLQADGSLAMQLLDKKLEPVANGLGTSFDGKQLSAFEGVVELLGSIHELRGNKKTVEFNLAVFRKFVNGEVTYYYAGNNKDKEEVDLIKVLFVGHQILEEEEYERTTFSHEQFLEMVESGLLKEVNPMEVANYVAGKLHGNPTIQKAEDEEKSDEPNVVVDAFRFEDEDAPDTDEEDEDEDEDICEDCEYPVEDCDCELW